MSDLQRIVVLCVVAAAIAVAAVWYLNTTAPDTQINPPSLSLDGGPTDEAVADFKFALEEAVRINIGQPIEGYEPQMFMQVYSGLHPEDFDGVASQQGRYAYREGELQHEFTDDGPVHSAGTAITEAGVETLLTNVLARMPEATTVESVFEALEGESTPEPTPEPEPLPTPDPEPVACTMDAMMCPDGSYVGRVGPDCEFAACPEPTEPEVVQCTDEMKQTQMCTREYRPVCGLVQVQCITTPCDPVPETFSNGCSACAQGNVISYTEGACQL